MNSISGKVAIVTGAASGIGRATARRFVQEGAVVVGIDRDGDALRTVEGIEPFVCDVTAHADLKRCVGQAVAKHGGIDILVNNAGICHYARLMDSTLADWRDTQSVNIEAMYALAGLVVPHMVRRRGGRIVNVASIQAFAADPTVGAYAASKGAIAAWSRAIAVDLAEHGILVNVIAPGCIRTGMSIVGGMDETTTEDFKEWYVRRRKIPLARAGEPEEAANAILFLCGDQCTYITGQTLVVDGGLTITF